jgi:ABC-type glycerol-3-phosphate transport system substrate-binding protein
MSDKKSPRNPLGRFGHRLAIGLAAVALVFLGFGCKVTSREAAERMQPVTLKWWSVFSDYDSLAPLIAAYRQVHPNVTVEYRKLTFAEYEDALLDAMAEDRGPDIISLHNTWLREWQDRLLPSPPVLSMAFKEIKGSIKKEEIITLRNLAGATPKQVANDFLDVVYGDVVLPQEQADPRLPAVDRVYGLPLSVDTMVLYYNRDMLNRAGVAQPAQYWNDFQQQVKLLTQLDETGMLVQSAAAIGTSSNVERASDVLSLLMIQNGTQMTDSSGSATFDRFTTETTNQALSPGATALVFFNDFANPLKEVYTWNEAQPSSFQAFLNGEVAYFFGYSYHLPLIKARGEELNYGIAPFPQIAGNQPVNYANYWVETVSNKTQNINEAWDLLKFVTSAEQAKTYLNNTVRPTALRSLVNSQLEDADLSVFASQLPSSQSWYKGMDGQAAEQVLADMITEMLAPEADPQRILELGAVKINQTIR